MFALFARARPTLIKVRSFAGLVSTTWMSSKAYSSVWLKLKNCPSRSVQRRLRMPLGFRRVPTTLRFAITPPPWAVYSAVTMNPLPDDAIRTIIGIVRSVYR